MHVMGDNPSVVVGPCRRVENVSWEDISRAGGFLDRAKRAKGWLGLSAANPQETAGSGGSLRSSPATQTVLQQVLSLYDTTGNVWERCQNVCTSDRDAVPTDGAPHLGPVDERRLRAGCHHNWDLRCRVF